VGWSELQLCLWFYNDNLLSIWSQDPTKWKRQFKNMYEPLVRHLLHQRNPTLFPYGQLGTPIAEMSEQLLRSDNIIASNWTLCGNCGHEDNLNRDLQTCVLQCPDQGICITTSACLQKQFQEP
jgi:hypothetical protein